MNKMFALIAVFIISMKVLSAQNETKVDTLIYLEIDIRSISSNPVVVAGVVRECDFLELSKKDGESLIKSFYRQVNFVPNFLAYNVVVRECIRDNEDSCLIKYIGQGQRIMNLIEKNGREIRVILNSGENAFIRVVKITGIFLFCNKREMQLSSTSNEITLKEVEEMDKICIPLEITACKKPSRKRVKEIVR